MKKETDLSDRMKDYEMRQDEMLLKRIPVIIRLDGKSFHTFTRKMVRPFDDDVLLQAMRNTMLRLCQNIQGTVFGYTQSDEITLVLVDYDELDKVPWFDYRVQKLCSLSAAMATLYFNQEFAKLTDEKYGSSESEEAAFYQKSKWQAMFDARAYNVPMDDVNNLLHWRQLDAEKNSVNNLARCYFKDKELVKKSMSDRINMLLEKKVNWFEIPTRFKRGTCAIKVAENGDVEKSKWKIDLDPPRFVKEPDYARSKFVF